MNKYEWEIGMKELSPYVPGEQPKGKDVVKLNTNENPYPPSPKVNELLKSFDPDMFRKYPDPLVSDLRKSIAEYHGVDLDEVFVGVGSDDVLAISFLTFFSSRANPILFPDITYSFYEVWADLFDISYEKCPLKSDFTIDTNDYHRDNGGIIIANPNAPTGIAMSNTQIKNIVSNNPKSIVIIDEAYIDFGGESMLDRVNDYDNLLVVRTFSKSRALAGSRIGYAIGNKRIIAHLLAVRDSFNSYTMDALTQQIGVESIRDDEYFKANIKKVIDTRRRSADRLNTIGFECLESSANFIFAKSNKVPAKEIFDRLKEKDIFVRYFNKPRISDYLRISIGTDEQMEKLFTALEEILG